MNKFFTSQTPEIYLNKSKTRSIYLAVKCDDLSNIQINFLLNAKDHHSTIAFDKDDFSNLCKVQDKIMKALKKGKRTLTIMNKNSFKIVVKEMHEKRGLSLTKNSGVEVRFLEQTFSNLMTIKRRLNDDYNNLTVKIKAQAEKLIKFTEDAMKNEEKYSTKKESVEKVIRQLRRIILMFHKVKF